MKFDIYYIKVGEKTEKNIFYNVGSKKCYYISKNNTKNYKEQPILKLNITKPSYFVIDTPNHPFYFTTNNEGLGYAPLNQPIEKGTMILPLPGINYDNQTFYYQCYYHQNMGNKINII
jgi:hypothetical protein